MEFGLLEWLVARWSVRSYLHKFVLSVAGVCFIEGGSFFLRRMFAILRVVAYVIVSWHRVSVTITDGD